MRTRTGGMWGAVRPVTSDRAGGITPLALLEECGASGPGRRAGRGGEMARWEEGRGAHPDCSGAESCSAACSSMSSPISTRRRAFNLSQSRLRCWPALPAPSYTNGHDPWNPRAPRSATPPFRSSWPAPRNPKHRPPPWRSYEGINKLPSSGFPMPRRTPSFISSAIIQIWSGRVTVTRIYWLLFGW